MDIESLLQHKKSFKKKDWKGIAVFIEQDEGKLLDISLELLGKAREMADGSNDKVYAYLFGHNVESLSQELIERGADKVVLADHELLDHYKWELYTKVSVQLIEKYKPSMMLCGATPNGRDLAGRLAVRLHTGLTADVIDLYIKDDLLIGAVPGFGGSVVAEIKCEDARPQMATIRPGIFSIKEKDPKRKGDVIKAKFELKAEDQTTRLVRKIKVDMEDISKAKRLIAAGRGVGPQLSLAQEMAEIIDGKIGVTRPLCDMGLLPRNYQIGSTGVTVKPDITVVWGASGAMHFTSGINDSDTIISVNMDETAPIFADSDYIVVADINALLPMVLDKLKARLGKSMEKEVS
ncbi:MAG: electron transfer flavoprotein subunit alpha/FixB family protein [Candidatus Kariarchaeaceae archaeon]|jgi:electron transfer flavoprotein alpha subunit